MSTSSGYINLVGCILSHTLSNSCNGSIIQSNVTGGTAPYSVSWSGVSGYNSDTFDIYNLCPGLYTATITDSLRTTGSTTFIISGLTEPSITVSLSDDSCVLDPNSLGKITISDSTTETSSYRYELRKDNKLIKTHYGTTADTTHTFTDIENGMYTVSVVEERPSTIITSPANTACTYTDFNDGGQYSGIGVTEAFQTWESFVPKAHGHISFAASVGPNLGASTMYFQSGLSPTGYIHTSNPYVWFYTGTTATRKTDSTKNWYLGASAFTSDEGGDYGPILASDFANVGYFYYNTYLNKFLLWDHSIGGSYRWVTFDPRRDYGRYGNPVASSGVTGTTYGPSIATLTSSDYTVNNSGNVEVATAVVTGDVNKFYFDSSANNGITTGLLSMCSYNNYTWETTFRAATDNDTISLVLASFRDDEGSYGPSGVTHTLSMVMSCNGAVSSLSLRNNTNVSAYGFNLTDELEVSNCDGGCSSSDAYYGKSTILKNTGTKIPFSGTSTNEWASQGSIRTKIVRYGMFGEFFDIQFTDTMGAAFGGGIRKANGVANPYNTDYNISLNLLDKTTWSGNSESAPTWASQHGLCKFLGSQRVGFWQGSQPQLGLYHMQFSGSPVMEHVKTPICGSDDGPTRNVEITATTATTLNIEQSKPCRAYASCHNGIPRVKPNVSVTYQNMPRPSLTVNGLSSPNVKLETTIGNLPAMAVYNSSEINEKKVEFYFGGDNQEMTFNTSFAKFGIYPYIYQTEELATSPDYEAFFDNLPNYIDQSTQGRIFSAQTNIPLSSLSLNIAWEYIIRPSYLYKQKTMLEQNAEVNEDIWIDTAQYPPNSKISNSRDLYMVVVQNPPPPKLSLSNFIYPVSKQGLALKTQRDVVSNIPAITATTYSGYNYGVALNSPAASDPLVTVNGLVVTKIGPVSGTTTNPKWQISPTGDYYIIGNAVIFNNNTIQEGDVIQLVYDAIGNTYNQSIVMPGSVSVSSASTIFEANNYYYINLDSPSLGAVSLSLNGVILINEQDYRKVDESRLQLLNKSDYIENDVIGIFYNTIYNIVGFTNDKNPKIPVSYTKSLLLEEKIIVRLFNYNGNILTEIEKGIKSTFIGYVEHTFELNPPEPGNYSYDVIVRRYYPLLSGEKIITEKITNRVDFEITRDVFYSPTGKSKLRGVYDLGPFSGVTNNYGIGGNRGGYST